MRTNLYGYQEDAVRGVESAWESGDRRVILSLPCGGGKTLTAAALIERHAAGGGRAAFMVDRTPLLLQSRAVFDREGLAPGVLWSDNTRGEDRPVVVGMHQTLDSRIRANDGRLPAYMLERTLAVIDEAHLDFRAARHLAAHVHAQGGRVLGLTATPLGEACQAPKRWDVLVQGPTADAMAEAGRLVAPRAVDLDAGFRPGDESLFESAFDSDEGEWTDGSVGRVMMDGDRVTAVARAWARAVCRPPAPPPRTLVFGATKAHAKRQVEAVRDAMAGLYGAGKWRVGMFVEDTPQPVRARMVAEFKAGGLRVLGSVAALAVGFDEPAAEVLLLCRPYKRSVNDFRQAWGRVCRTSESTGKAGAWVLDAGGNLARFGEFSRAVDAKGWAGLPTRTVGRSKARGWKCAKCGQENPRSAARCRGCGEWRCSGGGRPGPKCKRCDGYENAPGSVVCANCDWPLPGEESTCPIHSVPMQRARRASGPDETACPAPGCEFTEAMREAVNAQRTEVADARAAEHVAARRERERAEREARAAALPPLELSCARDPGTGGWSETRGWLRAGADFLPSEAIGRLGRRKSKGGRSFGVQRIIDCFRTGKPGLFRVQLEGQDRLL